DAEEDNQDGFDHGGQTREHVFDFFVKEVRDAFEHVVDFAGLFAGGNPANDHGWKDGMLAEGGGEGFAAFNVGGGCLDGLFHDNVADGLRDDLQHFENWHTAADERSEGSGETGEADFVSNATKDGQFNAAGIPEFPAGGGFDKSEPGPNAGRGT